MQNYLLDVESLEVMLEWLENSRKKFDFFSTVRFENIESILYHYLFIFRLNLIAMLASFLPEWSSITQAATMLCLIWVFKCHQFSSLHHSIKHFVLFDIYLHFAIYVLHLSVNTFVNYSYEIFFSIYLTCSFPSVDHLVIFSTSPLSPFSLNSFL